MCYMLYVRTAYLIYYLYYIIYIIYTYTDNIMKYYSYKSPPEELFEKYLKKVLTRYTPYDILKSPKGKSKKSKKSIGGTEKC